MATHRKEITEDQWAEAAIAFEHGLSHASEIAKRLGVSPDRVSTELRRRGCRKGRRGRQGNGDFIANVVRAICDADRAGELAALGPSLERLRRSMGAKPLRL